MKAVYKAKGVDYAVPCGADGTAGPVTKRVFETLTDIQCVVPRLHTAPRPTANTSEDAALQRVHATWRLLTPPRIRPAMTGMAASTTSGVSLYRFR